MNVCFVGESFSMLSGTTKPMFELAQKLSKRGINVTILTTEPSGNLREVHNRLLKEEILENNKNIRIVLIPPLYRIILFRQNNHIQFIRQILAESDIIHGADFLTLYALQRLLYKFKLCRPLIYSLTGCYKLHIEHLVNSGVSSFLNFAKPAFIFKLLCPNMIFNRIFNSFDKIISTSDFMVKDLYMHGISREKIVEIPVGIHIEQFDEFNKTRQISESYDFVYFGWGSSIRGVPDVVKAFSMVLKERSNAKLALFFLGSHGVEERLHSYLIKRCKDFGTSVRLSMDAKMNMMDIVKSSNAVVLPFRSPFGYSHPPLTVLESMLLGKPVISTYVGSIPEVISDGETGFLVRPKDVNALAQKMLLTYDKELTIEIGDRAQEYVMKTHDLKEVAKKTMDVYNEVIKG